MKKIIALALTFCFIGVFAQKKQITLEEIWRDKAFKAATFEGFNSMNDGMHYTQLDENNDLAKYELSTGKKI